MVEKYVLKSKKNKKEKEMADCPLQENFLQNLSQVYHTSTNQFWVATNIYFFVNILPLFSLSSAKSRL